MFKRKTSLLALFLLPIMLFAEKKEDTPMMKENVMYDQNLTRFRLVKSVQGQKEFDLLFLPGGPGVDANCFEELIKVMEAPGHYWLVDLPFNGTNQPEGMDPIDICQQWPDYLATAVKQFKHPLLIGHSFGGYLPLFCPDLEDLLEGLIILNSVPTIHSDLFAKCAREHQLPSLSEAQQEVAKRPSLESLKALYLLESFYFFAPKYREKGIKQVIDKMEFCIESEHWWYTKGPAFFSSIKWVPQTVPTLVVGGSRDYITPLGVFEEYKPFQRVNIQIVNIQDVGHFPWVERPKEISKVLSSFIGNIK